LESGQAGISMAIFGIVNQPGIIGKVKCTLLCQLIKMLFDGKASLFNLPQIEVIVGHLIFCNHKNIAITSN
jgi:hypothetical protein